ncbi:MAG: MarR family transcriptional regulator [Patescibacteria group bacterium]
MPTKTGQTEFALSEIIIMTSTRLRAIANRCVFRESKITGTQFRILRLLMLRDQQQPTEVLKLVGGTKSNVSQRIKSLEKQGFVVRSAHQAGVDRRNVYIAITASGRKLVEGLMQRFHKAAKSLENQFSQKEVAAQFDFFKKLNQLLDENEQAIIKLFE